VTIFLAVEFFPFDVVRRKVAVNAIAAAMGKIGFIVNKEGELRKSRTNTSLFIVCCWSEEGLGVVKGLLCFDFFFGSKS